MPFPVWLEITHRAKKTIRDGQSRTSTRDLEQAEAEKTSEKANGANGHVRAFTQEIDSFRFRSCSSALLNF